MNTKRQTIWLVSMLSIMVILSAYYLFTEPAGTSTNTNKVAQNQVDQTKKNATEASANGAPDSMTEVKINDVTDPNKEADGKAGQDNTTSPDATTDKGKDKKTGASSKDAAGTDSQVLATDKSDEAILDKLSKEGTASKDTIAAVQQERTQAYADQIDKLQAIVNDMNKSPEESGKAQEQMNTIDSQEQKITTLEESLRKEFGKAAIQHDKDRFKVIVASDQLEVAEAVSIVDLIVKELNVTQDKVSVQRIAP